MRFTKAVSYIGVTLGLLLTLSVPSAWAQRDEETMRQMAEEMSKDANFKEHERLCREGYELMATKPAEAEVLFRKAVAITGRFILPYQAQKGLAAVCMSQRKYRAATNAYAVLFEPNKRVGDSDEPLMLANYAQACLGIGEIGRAQEIVNRALKVANFSKSDPSMPLYDPERVVSVGELRAMVGIVRGVTYEFYSCTELAGGEYVSAVKAMPQSPFARYYLGTYYENSGKYAEAAAEYDKAIRYGSGALLDIVKKRRSDIARSLPAPKAQ